MCFYDKNGMIRVWRTASTQSTPSIWTHQCWTRSGSLICSLQTRKERISTRSPLTTSCCGSSKMEMFSTASGKIMTVWLKKFSLPHREHSLRLDARTCFQSGYLCSDTFKLSKTHTWPLDRNFSRLLQQLNTHSNTWTRTQAHNSSSKYSSGAGLGIT